MNIHHLPSDLGEVCGEMQHMGALQHSPLNGKPWGGSSCQSTRQAVSDGTTPGLPLPPTAHVHVGLQHEDSSTRTSHHYRD